MTDTQNACRHFRGLPSLFRAGSACDCHHDINNWLDLMEPGNKLKRLPCTKQTCDSKPFFDCPDLDRETDAEVEEKRRRLSEKMSQLANALPELQKIKKQMIADNTPAKVTKCVWCNADDALHLTVAIGFNNHMHAKCTVCDGGFIE